MEVQHVFDFISELISENSARDFFSSNQKHQSRNMSAADGGAAALLIAGLGTGGTDVMYEDDLTDNTIPDIQVRSLFEVQFFSYDIPSSAMKKS